MHVNHRPPWPTDSDATSHAHPSSADPAPPAEFKQRVEHLAASLPLHVKLHGLAAVGQRDAHDAYHPRVRRSHPTNQAIENIDVVTCWKGLSYSQACELAFWEHAFRECLTSQVEHALRTMIAAQICEQQKLADGLSLLLHLNERLASMGSHVISIDGAGLINSMMNVFYNEEPFRAGRSLTWGVSSENLPRFLRNLVRTQDCFMHDVDGPKVLIASITYDYSYPVFNITAEVAWLPPRVNFDSIPSSIRPQGEYCIAPVYVEPTSLFDASAFEPYPDRFHYTVTQSSSAAQWDPVDGCFRMLAPVPNIETGLRAPFAETLLSVSIITFFPGDVRLERCSRHRIVVDVTPADAPFGATSTEIFCERSPVSKFYITSPASELLSKIHQVNPDPLGKDPYDHLVHCLNSIAGVEQSTPTIGTSCRKRKAQLPNPDSGDILVYPSLFLEPCKMGSDAEKRRKVGSTSDEPNVEDHCRSPPEARNILPPREDESMRLYLQYHVDENPRGTSSSTASGRMPTTDSPLRQFDLPVIPCRPAQAGRLIPSWNVAPEVQAAVGSKVAQGYGGQGGLDVLEGPSRANNAHSHHGFEAAQHHDTGASLYLEAFPGLEFAQRHEPIRHSDTSTIGESGPNTPGSVDSPSVMPVASNDGNIDPALVLHNVRERHDSMEPELRRPVTRLRARDIPQEQILQNFRELLDNPKGPQHNDDFIDVFTDTEVEEDEEGWLSDADSDDDAMEDVCSEE